jgi:hypothetical protein
VLNLTELDFYQLPSGAGVPGYPQPFDPLVTLSANAIDYFLHTQVSANPYRISFYTFLSTNKDLFALSLRIAFHQYSFTKTLINDFCQFLSTQVFSDICHQFFTTSAPPGDGVEHFYQFLKPELLVSSSAVNFYQYWSTHPHPFTEHQSTQETSSEVPGFISSETDQHLSPFPDDEIANESEVQHQLVPSAKQPDEPSLEQQLRERSIQSYNARMKGTFKCWMRHKTEDEERRPKNIRSQNVAKGIASKVKKGRTAK